MLDSHPAPRRPRGRALRLLAAAFAALTVPAAALATTGTMTLTADTTLTEDHFGDIILAADGIVLDCDNYRVVGAGMGVGIDVVGRTDVLVVNCHVENHAVGFRIRNTTNSQFLLNSATANTSTIGGFHVDDCPGGVTVSMNRSYLNPNGRGFTVRDSDGVKLMANGAVFNGFRGFDVGGSSSVALSKNFAQGNGSGGFVVFGSVDVDLKKNQSLENDSEGFALLSLDDGKVQGNAALDNGTAGFRLGSGTGNQIRKNRSQGNGAAGFTIGGSGNVVRQNQSFLNGPPADMHDPSCPSPANAWTMNAFGSASCPAIN